MKKETAANMNGEIVLLGLKALFVLAAVGGYVAADSLGIFEEPNIKDKPEILNLTIKKEFRQP